MSVNLNSSGPPLGSLVGDLFFTKLIKEALSFHFFFLRAMTALASRLALASSPVFFNTELATCAHWRLALGDFAFFVE